MDGSTPIALTKWLTDSGGRPNGELLPDLDGDEVGAFDFI